MFYYKIKKKLEMIKAFVFVNYLSLVSAVCLFFQLFVDVVIYLANWETFKFNIKWREINA